ncbi:MAG TPA: phosphoglycerate dehydrogenase [Calditrichia bacterium]|nr:phosphoglycerate dehydrogenase [Calditrichia bacterium]
MHRILIADSLPESILAQYNEVPGITVENRSGISAEELAGVLSEYDGLVVRSRTRVTEELLENPGKLKVIGRAGAGVDNINTAAATRKGIIVMNTPGGNTMAAAEHTIALLLSALRNIPQAHAGMKADRWDRKLYMGHELFNKTVGVIGLGKIGLEVAKRLSAFQTNLLGYDPILSPEIADRLGIELTDFEDLLKRSDIITIHAPKMPETIDMINAENLKLCKDGVILVNCARGGLMNEAAVAEALDSGKVSMAAFDVFVKEPPEDWTLARHPRAVATPHLGASTEEAQTKVAAQILDQMLEYFQKNVAKNAVNFISVDERLQPTIAPYFGLASQLGALFSKLQDSRLRSVAIRFYGDAAELPSEPIASHLLAGALQSDASKKNLASVDLVNMVNALEVAREKGISLELTRKDKVLANFTNLIACDFHTESEMIHLAGSLFARDTFRLVEFGKYDVDANLSEDLIVVINDDVPGIIGHIGTALAGAGINITRVSSGRDTADKTAANLFNVEGKLEESLVKALSTGEHIRRVQVARKG